MQVLESNKNQIVPPQAAKLEGETRVKVPSENKNFSDVTIPFQDKQVVDKQSMPRLSPMAIRVSRCQNPLASSFTHAPSDKLRDETDRHNELLYQSWDQIRREAQDLLLMLIRFDAKFTMEDSRKLCDALNAINRVAAS